MIEVEQSAQPLGFMNRPVLTVCSLVGEGDDMVESLMIALVLMVGQKLLERVAQGTFAKENQLIETLILHGTDPAFREGVEDLGLAEKHRELKDSLGCFCGQPVALDFMCGFR